MCALAGPAANQFQGLLGVLVGTVPHGEPGRIPEPGITVAVVGVIVVAHITIVVVILIVLQL